MKRKGINSSLRGGAKHRRSNLITNNVKRLLRYLAPRNNISIICAPFSVGCTNDAAKDGPKSLLRNDLDGDLKELGFNVKIINPPKSLISSIPKLISHKKNRIKNVGALIKINEWLAETVFNEIKDGYTPFTIGGDHSLAIGTIAGTSKALKNIGVLWLDRHFDAHSPKNTKTWRAHGMPVAVAIGTKKYDPHPDFHRLLVIGDRDGVTPSVKLENFVQIGIGEKSYVDPKTRWYSMEHIDELGIKKVIDDALNYLLKRVRYVYIAWDIDSLNVTGTGTSGDTQLTLREGLVIARAINKRIRLSGRLAGFEIVEIAPGLERKELRGQTIDWATQIVTTCFGGNLFNNLSRMTKNLNVYATDL